MSEPQERQNQRPRRPFWAGLAAIVPPEVRGYARGALPLVVGLTVFNASNYLFHVAVSRLLGPADYGALVALLALVLVISVVGGVLQAAVAKKVAVLRAEGRPAEVAAIAAGMLKAVFAFGLPASLIFLLLSPALAGFLHTGVGAPALLAPFILFTVLTAIPFGVLQGQLRFTALAGVLLVGVIVRLAVGIPLAATNFGTEGAVFASVVAAAASLWVGVRLLRLPRPSWGPARWSLRVMWTDLRLSLLGVATFHVLSVVDDILARHYLAPQAAGLYSSGWILASSILFLPGAIAILALPRFAETAGRGDARRWMHTAVLGVAAVVVVAVPVVIALRHQLIALAFGNRYGGAAAFVPALAIANAFKALVLVLIYFHIAAGTRAYRLALTGLVAKVVLIGLFHRTPGQIALVVLGADAFVAILLYQAASAAAKWRPPVEQLGTRQLGEEYGVGNRPELDLTVVLPTHNGAPALRRVLLSLNDELSTVGSFELIVVSDGSTDETVELARTTGSPNVRVVDLPTREGKGSALRAGLAQARGAYVAFMDADGDIHPSTLRPFVSLMQLYRPDMVFGSKRHPLSEVTYPFTRRVMSWAYHEITRLLFRIRVQDTQTGVKMIRRDVLAAVLPRMLEKRFAFDLELLVVARSLGFKRIFEAPVRLDYRFSSNVGFRAVTGVLRDTLAIFYRRYILGTYADAFHGAPVPSAAEVRRASSIRSSSSDRVRILILNWRDIRNPEAGGAETFTHEIATRWVEQGHEVTLWTSSFAGSAKREFLDGVDVRRMGRLRTGSFHLLVQQELGRSNGFDVVIDEINTIPFFTPLRRDRLPPIVGLIHQMARDVWDAELPRPLAKFGRALEPRLLRVYKGVPLVTVSASTRKDLQEVGLHNVIVIPNGRDDPPPVTVSKESAPTLLFVGRMNKNKRPDHAIEAFRRIKSTLPEAQLWMVGQGPLERVLKGDLPDGAVWLGHVSREELYQRMARAHVLVVPSVREGWGLVVIEANSVGTPAVGYDVPGIRDSIRHGETGLLASAGDAEALADQALTLLQNRETCAAITARATEWSRGFSWDITAARLMGVLRANLEVARAVENGKAIDLRDTGDLLSRSNVPSPVDVPTV